MKQILTTLTLTLLATAPPPAQAQPHYLKQTQTLDLLENHFSKTQHALNIAQDNTIVKVFTSRKTSNWTITATLPNEMTYLLTSNHGFKSLKNTLPTLGTPI